MATRKKTLTAPSALPLIGQAWPALEGSIYAGVTTDQKGGIYALVLLVDKPAKDLDWKASMAWAKSVDASLPTRPESALLFANARSAFARRLHWTNEAYEGDASFAWHCHFYDGYQGNVHKSYEGCARAVRRFPLNPSILSVAEPAAVVA